MKPLREIRASFAIQEVTTLASLEALRPQWDELWERSTNATPFQTPEWLVPWWRYFGHGEMFVLTIRQGNRLAGIAPLFIHQRKVLLIGTANSDYLDVVVDDDAQKEFVEAIYSYLNGQHYRWDHCDFQQLGPGSPLLEATMPAGWREETSPQDSCPVLEFPDGSTTLPEVIPPDWLDRLLYYRRHAEKWGTVRIDAVEAGNLDKLFGKLIRLHSARWRARGLPGVLADRTVQDFHREVMQGFFAKENLRLYGMRINNRMIAVFYGFTGKARTYYYLGAFDPDFNRLSPGTQIIGFAIEQALLQRDEEFNFLRGREDYKYRWGAKDRLNHRRRLWHS